MLNVLKSSDSRVWSLLYGEGGDQEGESLFKKRPRSLVLTGRPVPHIPPPGCQPAPWGSAAKGCPPPTANGPLSCIVWSPIPDQGPSRG